MYRSISLPPQYQSGVKIVLRNTMVKTVLDGGRNETMDGVVFWLGLEYPLSTLRFVDWNKRGPALQRIYSSNWFFN